MNSVNVNVECAEILYNVMQLPVGHDQRAYSTSMLRYPNRKSVFLSNDHIQNFIYSQYRMHIYLKFETYNFQSKNLAHKGVDFYVQNALKLAYEHL